ncbi:MFS transporter [Lapidilactobacillus achengensis]|uniref:MFS transporter n=1 Tax=Lapidilactobacillus achengensis TaxID=2486000 RepID=A0ABW1UM21_9LACO|nr:MFS transporter [Lapidilactobacillus achengensis]
MNKNKRYLFSSRSISKIGDVLFDYGNVTWMAGLSAGMAAKYVALYQSVQSVVSIIFNLFGGAVADKANRKKLIVVANVLSGCACIIISLFNQTATMALGMIVVNSFLALIGAFSSPAYKSIIPLVMKKDDILNFNANMETAIQIINVSVPVLALPLVKLVGVRGALLIDGVSFFISALLNSFIVARDPNTSRVGKRPGILVSIFDGLKYVLHDATVRLLLIVSALINLFLAGYNYLLPFGGNIFMDNKAYAMLLSSGAIGSIIGAFMSNKIRKRISVFSLLSWLAASGVFIVLMALSPNLVGTIIANAIFEICLTIYNVQFFSILQMSVNDEIQGRVFSAVFTVAVLFMPVGTWMFSEFVSIRAKWGFLFAGLGICVTALIGMSYEKIWRKSSH